MRSVLLDKPVIHPSKHSVPKIQYVRFENLTEPDTERESLGGKRDTTLLKKRVNYPDKF